uniref:Uncharacterized protein n=1 Tax=Pinguiococcus pyrenoidosus TaxID=172671 RepID=A0A7R9U3F9_9STRA|mmetsp:Transcript_13391/g.49733  ORF Transcript_13391/g.49733 Transcript_13391/m.49733 type:complete len:846 (+) Transcript_13391:167-2704(+)
MSVAGVDLGSAWCLIATAARGGVDVCLNEASARKNAAMVCFADGQRHIGLNAESVVRSNYLSTVNNMRNIIGRKFDEDDIPMQATFCGAELVPLEDGFVGVKVPYGDGEKVLRPEQVVASLLGHLHSVAANSKSGIVPRYTAIGIPSYYTDTQRRALLNACKIADVNCLQLIHESTAIALEYGIFRSARKEFPEDKETKVLFLDMGASDFTATVVAFRNGELRVLSSCSDRTLGGRLFDFAIAKKICADFKDKYKNLSGDPEKDKKTFYKVLQAAEKAKKTISPHGVDEAPIYIEFLMDDYDFSGALKLEEFNRLTADLIERIDGPIQQALSEAGIDSPAELDAVEVVGGASRIRAVKERFQQIIGDGCRITTTMNADETVTRGAAMACALLAPVVRSMPFDIKDVYPFPVQLHIEGGAEAMGDAKEDDDDEDDGGAAPASSGSAVQSLFDRGFTIGATRKLVLRRQSSFNVSTTYPETAHSNAAGGLPRNANTAIAQFSVAGVSQEGGSSKIKVFLGTDTSGIVRVKEAVALEPMPEEEKPAEEPAKDGEEMDVDKKEGEDSDAKESAPVKKRKFRRRELPVTTTAPGLTAAQLQEACELEQAMLAQDEERRQTANIKNDLEAYIYGQRDAIIDSLKEYITAEEKESFNKALMEMEDWLYDDGYDATKEVYLEKLAGLKKLGDPINARLFESQNRQKAADDLKSVIQSFMAVANSTESKYAHLGDDDRKTIRDEVSLAEDWLLAGLSNQSSLPLNQDPVITVAQMQERVQNIRRVCQPIASKPKPKPKPAAKAEPEPEPEPAKGENGDKGAEGGEEPMDSDPADENAGNEGKNADNAEEMDVEK